MKLAQNFNETLPKTLKVSATFRGALSLENFLKLTAGLKSDCFAKLKLKLA